MSDLLTLDNLKYLVETGKRFTAVLNSTNKGFEIIIQAGMTKRKLRTARHAEPRIFTNAETAARLLNNLGIARFEWDVSDLRREK